MTLITRLKKFKSDNQKKMVTSGFVYLTDKEVDELMKLIEKQ